MGRTTIRRSQDYCDRYGEGEGDAQPAVAVVRWMDRTPAEVTEPDLNWSPKPAVAVAPAPAPRPGAADSHRTRFSQTGASAARTQHGPRCARDACRALHHKFR